MIETAPQHIILPLEYSPCTKKAHYPLADRGDIPTSTYFCILIFVSSGPALEFGKRFATTTDRSIISQMVQDEVQNMNAPLLLPMSDTT